MKNRTLYSIIALCIAVMLGACSNNDGKCHKDLTVRMGVALYQMVYDANTGNFVKQPYSTKLTVYGVDNNSILYKEKEMNSFEVPLHKTESISQFVLKTDQATDTLTIFHTNTQDFVSLECGCKVIHSINTAATTIHAIDSVGVRAPNITKTGETNLYVYYHVY